MKQHTVLTSLEKLKEWFDLNARPYFTIYRGYEVKNDRALIRNEETTDMESAWNLIERILEAYSDSGGEFRIYVTDKPGHNWGLTAFLKLKANSPEFLPNQMQQQQGIGGIWGIYKGPAEMIQAEVARAQEMWELKQQIAELEAAQSGKIGAIDRFMENLVERPELYQLIQALGAKLLMGQTPTPPAPVPNIGEQAQDAQSEGYDYDRVESALDTIHEVFPDTEGALELLAKFVKNNPAMAKQVLGTIQNQ